jgi:hypothetical protein
MKEKEFAFWLRGVVDWKMLIEIKQTALVRVKY